MKTIIMAIHPKWAEMILSGEKTIEVRTQVWKGWQEAKELVRILLYATSPVQAVVGEVRAVKVERKSLMSLVELQDRTNLTEEDLLVQNIFARGRGFFAIYLSRPIKYIPPKALTIYGCVRPPQSFCYPKKEVGDGNN